MRQNVGTLDKAIRVIGGAVIISFGVKYNGWWGAFGAYPIVIAAIGYSPLYALFGIRTCRVGGSSGCCRE